MDNLELIASYLDEEGKIISYPAKKKRNIRPYLYQYLYTKFEVKKDYSEKEVNEIIKSWILLEDYIIFRREMVEHGWLKRTRDGSKYNASVGTLDY